MLQCPGHGKYLVGPSCAPLNHASRAGSKGLSGVQVQRNKAGWPSNLVTGHVTAGRRRYAAVKIRQLKQAFRQHESRNTIGTEEFLNRKSRETLTSIVLFTTARGGW